MQLGALCDGLTSLIFMSIRVSNIRLSVNDPELALEARAARALEVRPADIQRWRILRKSLDARDKSHIVFVYALEVALADGEERIVQRAARRPERIAAEIYHEAP